jgi:hypothetical protein
MEIALIPQWLIRYIFSDNNSQYEANILISNVLIIAVFILLGNVLLGMVNAIPHFCLFDYIIGVQCPVCGITRAFCELSRANIVAAYKLNLSSLFVALFFVIQIPLRICSLCKPQMRKRITKISKMLSRSVVIIIILNWSVNLMVGKC